MCHLARQTLNPNQDFAPRVATEAGTNVTLTLAFTLSFAASAGETFKRKSSLLTTYWSESTLSSR